MTFCESSSPFVFLITLIIRHDLLSRSLVFLYILIFRLPNTDNLCYFFIVPVEFDMWGRWKDKVRLFWWLVISIWQNSIKKRTIFEKEIITKQMSSNTSPLPYPRVNLTGKNFVVHLAELGGSSGRPVSKGGAGFKTPFRSVPTEGKLG